MKKIIAIVCIFTIALSTYASDYEYKFRITLKNKGIHEHTELEPSTFLSEKAIERRQKRNIKIDKSDYPISATYLEEIQNTGSIIVAQSKWNKTVAVHCTDSITIDELSQLPFVQEVELVWRGNTRADEAEFGTFERYPVAEEVDESNYYGKAYDNIKDLKGDTLHRRGFMGEGMTIAVIDAGFNNYDKVEFFDNINLLGYKSFIYKNDKLFSQKNQHGTNVLSTIATNKPHQFVGSAPHASFWLLGTEDTESEFPIEEDYWAAAIEFADSVGVDVINTSLGYTNFDVPTESYTHQSLDGKKSLMSRSAGIAAKKGILVVVSAGNSGNKKWEKISVPGDAKGVLTVGAIRRDSVIANFSSRGLTADLRIKPDVVALGSRSMVIDNKGQVSKKSGTSFSSPIMCGIVACLWQALPTLSIYELLDVIRESAHNFDNPTIVYGFGIPDMEKAMELGNKAVENKKRRQTK